MPTGQVATNDFAQITLDLSTEWTLHHRAGAPDLYPEARRGEIDALNEDVFRDVNDGVYRAGRAGTQAAYDAAYTALFGRLDRLTGRLTSQRYLVGNTITEAGVRLFTTLVRFDAAYHNRFKCNRRKLTEMPVLWAYARDLFQTQGVGDTVDVLQIKRHYYEVQTDVNPLGIVPAGPDLRGWTLPHHRDELGSHPFGDGTPPGPPVHDEAVTGCPTVNPALPANRASTRHSRQDALHTHEEDTVMKIANIVAGDVGVTPAASNAEAVAGADAVVLAMPFTTLSAVAADLAGFSGLFIDATNPLTEDMSGLSVTDRAGAQHVADAR